MATSSSWMVSTSDCDDALPRRWLSAAMRSGSLAAQTTVVLRSAVLCCFCGGSCDGLWTDDFLRLPRLLPPPLPDDGMSTTRAAALALASPS